MQLEIVDGPDKPHLQRAIAKPDSELVHFRLADDGIDAQINEIVEQADGTSFEVTGVIRSGDLNGSPFHGYYRLGDRSGTITV